MTTIINFYSTSDEYGYFSNFSNHPVLMDGKRWPTSEHYFQAMKFEDRGYQEKIRASRTPMIAARLGRDRSMKIKRGWDSMRVQVMTDVVLAKFTQHEDLKLCLIATGNAKLIEHTANDDFWGDGGDGSGKNMLGTILMRVRDKIIAQQGEAL